MLTIGVFCDKLINVVATDKRESTEDNKTKIKKLLTDSERCGNLI